MFIVIFIIIIIAVISIIKLLSGNNYIKNHGSVGESVVARKLRKLNPKYFIVLNDLLIKSGNYTNQIDHVVISIYGIFVIETKNYNGWIHGNQKSEYWTQTFRTKKVQFKNPILQNWGHIKALNRILKGFGYIKYHPIVVFTGDAELKNVYTEIPVIYTNQIISTIKEICTREYFSEEDIKNIKNKLLAACVENQEAFQDHIKQVKHFKKEQQEREKNRLCPRCGRELKLIYGQYGPFYGCSGYPGCGYTKSI